jgi:hypothetical protein
MRKKKKRSRLILLAAVILVIVIIAAVIIYVNSGTQSSAPLVAGVKPGDTFTYELQGLWEPNNSNTTVSDSILVLNMSESYQVTITNVSDSEIRVHNVWLFKNGTEIGGDGQINIETGISSGGFWALYAANLNSGQRTRPEGPDTATINSTMTRTYPDGTRETNILQVQAQYYNVSNPSQVYTEYMTVEFDKQTGILTQLTDERIYNNPEMKETILWRLTDSNVWAVT